ncbi:hypothetical protein AMTR_s00047p00081200 [Amborella trichopoda]|uniref:Uncharacterized protein n=1 Tax=Amborella trichopoda TaxID=13333 RepID=U5D5M2_AMBTC|nr:hypothetical protein AMTR_s00047p00081200 [Amborella trichopoda]
MSINIIHAHRRGILHKGSRHQPPTTTTMGNCMELFLSPQVPVAKEEEEGNKIRMVIFNGGGEDFEPYICEPPSIQEMGKEDSGGARFKVMVTKRQLKELILGIGVKWVMAEEVVVEGLRTVWFGTGPASGSHPYQPF